MLYQLKIDANCDMGLVRSNNEDMIAYSNTFLRDGVSEIQINVNAIDKFFIAVADGMGGHSGGEVASEMVLKDLNRFVETLPSGMDFNLLKMAFDRWVQQIHNQVIEQGHKNSLIANMGTTLVALVFYEGKVCYLNAGDSRLYRFRQNILRKITTDHSLREMGGIKNAPSNMLMNSIGGGKKTFIDFVDITNRILNKDVYMLCSDGLSDLVNDDAIEEILINSNTAKALVSVAKENGGKDNVSVVQVTVNKINVDEN